MKIHAWIYNVIASAIILIYAGSFALVALGPLFGVAAESIDQVVKKMAENAPEALLALMIRWPSGNDRAGDRPTGTDADPFKVEAPEGGTVDVTPKAE